MIFFLREKNSLEGQMVQPWRIWTVKFQVETVPRVATLHLACYRVACVVSRPQPLLMASTWLSLAQTNVQWLQQQLLQCNYKCGIHQKWWLIIAIYFIIGSDFHSLICVYIMYFVPDVRQVFLNFDINYIFFFFFFKAIKTIIRNLWLNASRFPFTHSFLQLHKSHWQISENLGKYHQ